MMCTNDMIMQGKKCSNSILTLIYNEYFLRQLRLFLIDSMQYNNGLTIIPFCYTQDCNNLLTVP